MAATMSGPRPRRSTSSTGPARSPPELATGTVVGTESCFARAAFDLPVTAIEETLRRECDEARAAGGSAVAAQQEQERSIALAVEECTDPRIRVP